MVDLPAVSVERRVVRGKPSVANKVKTRACRHRGLLAVYLFALFIVTVVSIGYLLRMSTPTSLISSTPRPVFIMKYFQSPSSLTYAIHPVAC